MYLWDVGQQSMSVLGIPLPDATSWRTSPTPFLRKFIFVFLSSQFGDSENQVRIRSYVASYYVALKLRFFTPGPIHRISSLDGCYLAMGCLPLNITNSYLFWGSEFISTTTRAWRYRSGVSRKSIVGTLESVHGSESMNWVRVTGAGQVYLSHIGGCAPDRVIWLATLLRSGVCHGILVDACRASTAESGSAVEGAVCTGCYFGALSCLGLLRYSMSRDMILQFVNLTISGWPWLNNLSQVRIKSKSTF
jgi:hypothetical protein